MGTFGLSTAFSCRRLIRSIYTRTCYLRQFSVEGMTADRKLYVLTQDLSLPPLTRESRSTTRPEFRGSQKVRFRYKLEGHDVEWQDAGTRRQAFYNDLRPVRLRSTSLRATTTAYGRNRCEPRFVVAPAWFQTAWFRSLRCVFVPAACSIYQLRVRSIAKAINARFDERLDERTRMALELHDTFLQTVQGSKMMADDALDQTQTRCACVMHGEVVGLAGSGRHGGPSRSPCASCLDYGTKSSCRLP